MKTNITSLELHCLIKELKFLEGARIDNIYNPEKEELIIIFHIPSKGKQILRAISGKLLYLSSIKENYGEPSGFCMLLRKHIGNARLKSISQIESERIVEFIFEKEEEKKLIIELFGKGNFILCDADNKVISALVYHTWKDREIKPKAKYEKPERAINFLKFELEELEKIINDSELSLIKCLATEIGLGGSYSEEICSLTGIDKNKDAGKLEEKEIKKIEENIKKIANKKIEPLIVYEDEQIKDIVPFELSIYKNLKNKKLNNYSEAFDYYFLNEHKEEKPKSNAEQEIERLKRRMEKQEEGITELEKKEKQTRKKAEIIYNNYKLIDEILTELKKASEKHSWEEIKKKIDGHKIVKSINTKDKTAEIEVT